MRAAARGFATGKGFSVQEDGKETIGQASNQAPEGPRKIWSAPDLRKLDARDAEDNAGSGADSNGRLS